tara:strand:+ start:4095 stop:4334 length:240 start_codon:yes stop_codon:yes gene_type:complete
VIACRIFNDPKQLQDQKQQQKQHHNDAQACGSFNLSQANISSSSIQTKLNNIGTWRLVWNATIRNDSPTSIRIQMKFIE